MKHIGYLKLDKETSAIVGDRRFMIMLWAIVKEQITKHNEETEEEE